MVGPESKKSNVQRFVKKPIFFGDSKLSLISQTITFEQ